MGESWGLNPLPPGEWKTEMITVSSKLEARSNRPKAGAYADFYLLNSFSSSTWYLIAPFRGKPKPGLQGPVPY